MTFNRRRFLEFTVALASLQALGVHAAGSGATSRMQRGKPHVVVVGGGFGGATAARYLQLWGGGAVRVTLVEREAQFTSCPLSNLVLSGTLTIADLTRGYDRVVKAGVRRIRDTAVAVDPRKKTVRLAGGNSLTYDRLILSPGVDFIYDQIPSLVPVEARERVLHAWKAGPQTTALWKQLESMPDGGVFAMHIPVTPYRCPPGPYERACQVAYYFSRQKPKSKVIILDANPDVQSKKALFTAVWTDRYKNIIEYRPNSNLIDVDVRTLTAKLDFDNVKADVLNVIPPQHAGAIAREGGLANANRRFCQVDFLTYESTAEPHIHVLGDAIQIAAGMPKSGHMANQHGKVCAAATLALLSGKEVNPNPVIANTCYSFADDKQVFHVASVHAYDATHKTMAVVTGSGGLSPGPTEMEGQIARAWAANVWSDMLG